MLRGAGVLWGGKIHKVKEAGEQTTNKMLEPGNKCMSGNWFIRQEKTDFSGQAKCLGTNPS